jgi:hypothetical protein
MAAGLRRSSGGSTRACTPCVLRSSFLREEPTSTSTCLTCSRYELSSPMCGGHSPRSNVCLVCSEPVVVVVVGAGGKGPRAARPQVGRSCRGGNRSGPLVVGPTRCPVGAPQPVLVARPAGPRRANSEAPPPVTHVYLLKRLKSKDKRTPPTDVGRRPTAGV